MKLLENSSYRSTVVADTFSNRNKRNACEGILIFHSHLFRSRTFPPLIAHDVSTNLRRFERQNACANFSFSFVKNYMVESSCAVCLKVRALDLLSIEEFLRILFHVCVMNHRPRSPPILRVIMRVYFFLFTLFNPHAARTYNIYLHKHKHK